MLNNEPEKHARLFNRNFAKCPLARRLAVTREKKHEMILRRGNYLAAI
jgi:hypothetical protein